MIVGLKVLPMAKVRSGTFQFLLHVLQRGVDTNQKFQMMPVQRVDVRFTVEASVHDQLDLFVCEKVHVRHELLNR
ncbi:hypothetical protein D1872_306000 [compost metagenome]